MKHPQDGWRSARSRRFGPPGATGQPPRPASPSLPAGPPAPAVAPPPRRRMAAPVAPAAAAAAADGQDRQSLGSLWKLLVEGVEWSPVYLCFLLYIYVVVTRVVALGDVAMVGALVGLLLQKEPLRLPPFLVSMGVFVVWAVVGYSTTDYPALVTDGMLRLVKLWAIALVAVNALRTRAQLRFFIIFFLACYAFYPTRGAYFNYYIYKQRVFGRAVWQFIYGNPNDLGMLTILQLSMAAGLLYTEGKGLVRTAALAGVGMLTLLVFMTQSRGAILGLGIFGLAAFFYSKRSRLQTMLTFAAVAVVLAVFAPKAVWTRLSGLRNISTTGDLRQVDEEGSADQRFEIWKVARKVIKAEPLFGIGVGAYSAAHFEYSQQPDIRRTAHGYRDTHSTFLNVAAEMGYPGLVLFLLTFGMVAVRAERVRRRARLVTPRTAQQLLFLELGLLAFFVAGVFGSYAHLAFAWIHLVLLWTFAESTAAEAAALEGGARRAAPAAAVRAAGWRTAGARA